MHHAVHSFWSQLTSELPLCIRLPRHPPPPPPPLTLDGRVRRVRGMDEADCARCLGGRGVSGGGEGGEGGCLFEDSARLPRLACLDL